jgi:hypothetical protein
MRRSEILFAVGNVVPAIVLGVGLYALPVRWWPADFVIGAAVLALPITSGIVFARPSSSRRALRVGASVLLAVGLVLIAAAVLSCAFLAGIHGDFGQGGVTLMTLVTFLVLPYAVVYPVLELLWLGPPPKATRTEGDPKPERQPEPAREPAPVAPTEPEPTAAPSDGGAAA